MKNPKARAIHWAVMIVFCVLPDLLVAQERPADFPPLTVSGINEIIIIDRLIADRAYANLKAGRPADQGIDFWLLDQTMEQYRSELEKFDPAYYAVLRQTYDRMKEYVTNPQSDFIRAIKEPGSVEFSGRNPLPAAAFSDSAFRAPTKEEPARAGGRIRPGPGRGIDELEPFLSPKAKASLARVRRMPESTAAEHTAKLGAVEAQIAAWKRDGNRLEAEVMVELLQALKANLQPPSARLGIEADMLPAGMTVEMFDKMYSPARSGLPAAEEPKKADRDRPLRGVR